MLTPAELGVLIHCRVSPLVHHRFDTRTVQDALEKLQRMEVVAHEGDNIYRATSKGAAWLITILKTPMPVEKKVWMDAKGAAPL